MFSGWLNVLAIISLSLGAASASIIAFDILSLGRRQSMRVMDLVWPVTALWSGPLGLAAYFWWGRAGTKQAMMTAKERGEDPPNIKQPFPVLVGKGATHCGSGCTLGDLVAEWLILAIPIYVFGHTIFGAWIYDYILAFTFGIAIQYFTIKPMRGLSVGDGIKQALKADTLSLSAWQVGMYGWMAIATFAIFGREMPKTSPVFWFMMQLGMLCGFLTSYPVNGWLLKRGIKEAM